MIIFNVLKNFRMYGLAFAVQGLPSPSAAGFLAAFVWVVNEYGMQGTDFRVVTLFLTLIAGVLMVSK